MNQAQYEQDFLAIIWAIHRFHFDLMFRVVVPLETILRIRYPPLNVPDNHHRLSPPFSRNRVVY
jgi:hypothetical protein